MTGDKILFLWSEGLKNLWRHKLTAFASIFSIFLALVLVGGLVIAGQNTNSIIRYLRDKYKIEVFFKSNTSLERSQELVRQIRRFPGVRSTTLISKEDALKIFESQFGEKIQDLVGFNPLPISCVVNVNRNNRDQFRIDPIIDKIRALPEVDEVNYQGNLIYRIENIFQKFLKAAMVLSGLIIIISIIIISNTLRLTIYAKRELITALQLVGATRSFVKAPFIIEGVLQGILGAALAAGLISFAISFGNKYIFYQLFFKLKYDLFMLTAILAGIAVIISIFGSSRAINKFLK
ncbi:MAG: permease-like cell division protein FtsX [Candidatus Neomarinimicrobiota bacterium]